MYYGRQQYSEILSMTPEEIGLFVGEISKIISQENDSGKGD